MTTVAAMLFWVAGIAGILCFVSGLVWRSRRIAVLGGGLLILSAVLFGLVFAGDSGQGALEGGGTASSLRQG